MELDVNGKKHRIDSDPERSLLFVLRNSLDITGPK
jgi:aerobic-type carbon monoxide dehydrogenase small subunit (CoxS/CutS family)